ncbi:unknown [Candidatus Colimorpha enterica]|uniref:Uncharacterized protein n=1 Tax=Candidatus Colimorpha enterica TaxID=3083063 RepID=R6TZ15_9BACT|nr:unknown [Candidatus Colimorpha enterica]
MKRAFEQFQLVGAVHGAGDIDEENKVVLLLFDCLFGFQRQHEELGFRVPRAIGDDRLDPEKPAVFREVSGVFKVVYHFLRSYAVSHGSRKLGEGIPGLTELSEKRIRCGVNVGGEGRGRIGGGAFVGIFDKPFFSVGTDYPVAFYITGVINTVVSGVSGRVVSACS